MITRFSSTSNINEQRNIKKNFKGLSEAVTPLMNYLNTNQAVGAIAVDVASMGAPRTLTDSFRKVKGPDGKEHRNPNAAIETGFREFSSTANHAAAGVMGLGVSYLLSHGLNSANGVKAHKVYTNSDAIDIFSGYLKDSLSAPAEKQGEVFYRKFLENIYVLNSKNPNQPWSKLEKSTIDEAVPLLAKAKTNSYNPAKDVMTRVLHVITGDTGANSTVKIIRDGKEYVSSLENTISNGFQLRKATIDKLSNDLKNGAKVSLDEFYSMLKRTKSWGGIAGLAIPAVIGMSLQPLNMYMTKKRTGSDGFVGVDTPPDKSLKFKILKSVMGIGIGAGIIATIAKNPKEILSKIQFKSIIPTIDQFKLIYGVTIMSRMMAARDKNELRECTFKDTLGFVNWLILGGFVSKLVLKRLDPSLINFDATKGNGFFKWAGSAVEKTHDEIIQPMLKKAGIALFDEQGKALSMRKLLKALTDKAPDSLADEVKHVKLQLKYKNIAQFAGYVYSGLVLGFCIPKLNIAITNMLNKKNNIEEKSSGNTIAASVPLPVSSGKSKTFGAFLNAMQG